MKKGFNRVWAILLCCLLLVGTAPAASLAGVADWLSVTAAAENYSGTCGANGDNVTWTLDTDTGTLTISGTGEMIDFDYYYGDAPWAHYRDSIQTVEIEDGVTSIGDEAFQYCSSLASITIPDSVTSIGDGAFYSCTGLASITIPDSVTSIGKCAFNDCSSLVSITIPDSVTIIGYAAFRFCTSLTRITIPDSVTSIDDEAFWCCSSLMSITIPDSVTSIGYMAFGNCSSLTAFSVDIQNTNYSSDTNGVLYNKSKSTLIQYPIGNPRTAFTIPDSVTNIYRAFQNCTSLASVTIGNGVASIDSFTFENCTSLASVTIGNGVASIGYWAFDGCDMLTDVYYMGTPAEWKAITIQDYNEPLLNATIHFIFDSDEPYLTLHCPAKISEAAFEAYGVANPDAEVSVYDGETLLGTVQVSETGDWRGSFTLQNPADPSEHTITATVTLDEQTATESKTLTYDKKAVYPTAFTLTHSGSSIDLLNVRYVHLTVVPSKPMEFEVRLNTNEDVHSLEVISVKDAEVKSISASFDSAAGTWKASGWFDPANHSYVPGSIDLRINGERILLESAKVHYLIDPSGYVYEAVKSNRVEGATASIYVKDGASETLWDANRYEQDNPQTTDAFGVYHWDVTEGTWRVKAEKDGYTAAYSDWMDVPPEWTEVAIPLVTTQAPQIEDVTYDSAITVTFSQYMDIATVNADHVTVQCGGTAVPVTVTPVNAEESGTDSTVSYASVFRVQPQAAFWGKADVRIEQVKNYAGIEIAQAYTCTVGEEHEHTAAAAVKENETPATCTEAGKYDAVVYCKDCGAEMSRETVSTPKLGHDFGAWTADGDNHVRACTRCTETETAAHVWGDAVVTGATCQAEGSTVYTCTACGAVRTESIPKTDHTPAAAVKENETPATCTEAGKYDAVVYCKDCGTEMSRETVDAPALGHSFTNYVYNNDATTEKDGTKTAKCDRCDATDTIPAAGTKIVPKVSIKNYTANRTVDYRASITFTATVENAVDGAAVHWFVNGQDKGTGETITVPDARGSYTLQAKYMKDSSVLAESPVETINVRTDFFARLKAFFRSLFGRLPKQVQEAYDFDLFLNLLP